MQFEYSTNANCNILALGWNVRRILLNSVIRSNFTGNGNFILRSALRFLSILISIRYRCVLLEPRSYLFVHFFKMPVFSFLNLSTHQNFTQDLSTYCKTSHTAKERVIVVETMGMKLLSSLSKRDAPNK